MKKARLVLAALILATVGGSVLSASASHCGSGNGHDPFGSCENGASGHVECGPGTVIPGVGTVATPTNSSHAGVEGCAEDSSALPIAGRVGVWTDGNKVVVFADGDDYTNSGGAAAWDRVEVYTSGKACVKRGSTGQWSNSPNGNTNSNPDGANVCTP